MSFWDDAANAVGDLVDDGKAAAEAAAQAVADAAQAAADAAAAAAAAAAKAAADAAEAAKEAFDKAVQEAKEAAATTAHAATGIAHELGNDAQDAADAATGFVKHAASDPSAALKEVEDAAGDTAKAVGDFIADHQKEIVGVVETVGTVALYASGVGAVVAAVVGAATTAGTEVAEGTDVGDALIDGGASALDKIEPGAGSAAKTVIHGLENGESAGDIAKDAGMQGVGANGGPLLGFAATIDHDATTGASPLQWGEDLGNQFAASATQGQPAAAFLVAAGNDIADGKDIAAIGYDAARIYLHDAAGGDASPTAQATDTFLGDLSDGKSLREAAEDTYDQAVASIDRVEKAAPGSVDKAIDGSGIPGADLGKTLVDDIIAGKKPEDIAKDVGRQAVSDAVDASGIDQDLKDHGIDSKDLDPLKPYAQQALEDVENGKSPSDVAGDLVRLGEKDAMGRIGDATGEDLTNGSVDTSRLGGLLHQVGESMAGQDSGNPAGGFIDTVGSLVETAADGAGSQVGGGQTDIGSVVSRLIEPTAGADATTSTSGADGSFEHLANQGGLHRDVADLASDPAHVTGEASAAEPASTADVAGLGGLFQQAAALQPTGATGLTAPEGAPAAAVPEAATLHLPLDNPMGHDLPPVAPMPDLTLAAPDPASHFEPAPVDHHLAATSVGAFHLEHFHI